MTCLHKLVADVTVLADDGGTVLVRYAHPEKYDGETGWFVPDDYLQRLEDPAEAAQRILREQLGIDAPHVGLSHVESFEGDGFWHLVFHYRAAVPSRLTLVPSTAVARADWFDLAQLPPPEEVGHGGWALDTISEVQARR